ncbi:MAG: HEAT repeat domain-containing protein, partial [Planctomycetes bacterium]|nr:HEAT repeat domain-containing protein [Planctomycetota bacterium]
GDRVRALARLALSSGRVGGGAAPLDPERAGKLVTLLFNRFAFDAREELATTLAAAGPAFARRLAADPRPAVRAATARVLAESAQPEDERLLLALVEDREPAVEIAAIDALGERKVEAARTELVVRARLGVPQVRAAALLAIGKLGGEFVLDALLLGASENDPIVRSAAAQALAELGDPAAASLLLSMLAEGGGSVVFGPARAGLVKLGEKAWPELVRAVNKTNHPARREAALILAEAGQAAPVTALMQALATHPQDARVANELAVLTCVDFRGEPDPASAWWGWYEGVVHDDAHAWFRAALERAGEKTPSPEALRPPGTRAGRLFLVEVLARPEAQIAERARRELARLLARELEPLPARGAPRDAWIAEVREAIANTRDP